MNLGISIGALFSISSALNATLYGGANISYSLAKDGELPEIFERKIWFKSTEGLYITAGLSVLFSLFFNMSGIASITSAIFTVIYIFVVFSHLRIRKEFGGNRYLLIFNLTLLILVFLTLLYYQWKSQASVLYSILLVVVGALLVESVFRYMRKRAFTFHRKMDKENS